MEPITFLGIVLRAILFFNQNSMMNGKTVKKLKKIKSSENLNRSVRIKQESIFIFFSI